MRNCYSSRAAIAMFSSLLNPQPSTVAGVWTGRSPNLEDGTMRKTTYMTEAGRVDEINSKKGDGSFKVILALATMALLFAQQPAMARGGGGFGGCGGFGGGHAFGGGFGGAFGHEGFSGAGFGHGGFGERGGMSDMAEKSDDRAGFSDGGTQHDGLFGGQRGIGDHETQSRMSKMWDQHNQNHPQRNPDKRP